MDGHMQHSAEDHVPTSSMARSPHPGTDGYENLPQFSARFPLPFRRTIRRPELHHIINKPSEPAWLKDLAVIDMGLYRRFYRQKRTSFAGAGDGAICGASTLSTSLSIDSNHTLQAFALQHGMLPT